MPIALLLIFLSSCSIFQKKGEWGKRAIYPLTFKHVSKAFERNVKNPHVWAPLLGAGFIYSFGYDQKISDWATSDSLFFRDDEAAQKYSNSILEIIQTEAYLSILLSPSMPEDQDWKEYSWRKIKGGSVAYFGTGLAHSAGTQLKNVISRERPNGNDIRSFPSGHAVDLGASQFLLARNLETSKINPEVKTSLRIVNLGMASTAVWARVEAKAHFTSDVLAGYAIGTFVSGFIYDSLMNLEENESFTLSPAQEGGLRASYTYSF